VEGGKKGGTGRRHLKEGFHLNPGQRRRKGKSLVGEGRSPSHKRLGDEKKQYTGKIYRGLCITVGRGQQWKGITC